VHNNKYNNTFSTLLYCVELSCPAFRHVVDVILLATNFTFYHRFRNLVEYYYYCLYDVTPRDYSEKPRASFVTPTRSARTYNNVIQPLNINNIILFGVYFVYYIKHVQRYRCACILYTT